MEGLDQFGLRIQVRRTRHLHCLHSLVPAHDPSSLPHSGCGPYTPFPRARCDWSSIRLRRGRRPQPKLPLMANATRFTEPLWSRFIT